MNSGNGSTQGWGATSATIDGDVAYHTQSLRFTQMELSLDESVSFRALWSLFVRAWLASFAAFAVFAVIGIIEAISSSGLSGTGPLEAGYFISFFVFWIVFLFSQSHEAIAEWRILLDGKAAAATSAYAAMYGSLARRRIPVGVTPMRVRSDVLAPESVNSRLVITERSYIAYISVFEFGTSLYAGWMLWRNRRGVVLVGTFLKDVVGGMLLRTSPVKQMLRTEKVRAMREAVHSAVREGVDVAVDGIEVTMVSTFGYDIPIQDLVAVGSAGSVAPPPPPATGWDTAPAPRGPQMPDPHSPVQPDRG